MSEKEEIRLDDKERQPCEVWTRVMGYHRPVSSFNVGKKGNSKNASALLKISATWTRKPFNIKG